MAAKKGTKPGGWTSMSIRVTTKRALEQLGRRFQAGYIGPDGRSIPTGNRPLSATRVTEILLAQAQAALKQK